MRFPCFLPNVFSINILMLVNSELLYRLCIVRLLNGLSLKEANRRYLKVTQ